MKTVLRWFTFPFTWGLLALVWFLCQMTPWVYPGESAAFMAHVTHVWLAPSDSLMVYPLSVLIFGGLGKFLPITIAIPVFNLLSAIFGAVCVATLCAVVRKCFEYFVDEPRSRPFLEKGCAVAVPMTGIGMMLSPSFLLAATHFNTAIFDTCLILWVILLFFWVRRYPKPSTMACVAFLIGLFAFESTILLLLTPFLVLGLALIYGNEQKRILAKPFVTHLIFPFFLGGIVTLTAIIVYHRALEGSGAPFVILKHILLLHFATIQVYFTGAWLLMALVGILPAVLTLFMVRDVGKNWRTPTLFFVYVIALVLTSLAILPGKLSVETLLTAWNVDAQSTVFPMLSAFSIAGLMTIGVFFFSVKQAPEAAREYAFVRRLCRFLGIAACWIVPLVLLIAGAMVTVGDLLARRSVATLPRDYCDEVLAGATTADTWLLSDGVADVYLALRVAEKALPITVFSLTHDKNQVVLRHLQARLEASPYFSENAALRETLSRSLDVGMIPFVQDWLRADDAATQRFITLGLPDLWYTGDRLPLPQTLWYKGVTTRDEQHKAILAMPIKDLTSDPKMEVDALPFAMRNFARYIHRQRGFVANNTAFYLADAGELDRAFKLFEMVYAYDDENVSALFNLFELIHGGLYPEKRAWCEEEVNTLIRKMRGQRYLLWALARTYGYIRSPQLMSMLAGAWAMSGQTGAALSGLDLALAMLDDGQKVALNKAIADICMSDPSRRDEAIARYQQMLKNSKDHRASLVYVRELVRMHILNGDLEAAKAVLEAFDPTGEAPDLAYERALWFSSAGQPERAMATLNAFLETEPRHLEALTLLATLQLQAGDLDTLTAVLLPKVKTAAGTEDNYFVQIIMAQLAERQNNLVKARAAYLRALGLKPEVHALRTTVLTLDIRLNDKAAAEYHAKEYLYQDRTLPLANYVMGSLALGRGDFKRALSYLTTATAPTVDPPLPEAFNDLAEAQRRLGDWNAAFAAAQHACKLSPNLAIARETAAAALLELGRYKEAHAYLEEAFAIEKRVALDRDIDPRCYITRARLYAKEGKTELARVDLIEARKQYETLDDAAKNEFDVLANEVHLR